MIKNTHITENFYENNIKYVRILEGIQCYKKNTGPFRMKPYHILT